MFRDVKILHLATDDKFIDQGLSIFKKASDAQNRVFVCGYSPLKYVKSEIELFTPLEILLGKANVKAGEFDILVLHSLNQNWFPFVRRISKKVCVVWLGWGLDYYDLLYTSECYLYKEKTNELWRSEKFRVLESDQKNNLFKRLKKFIKESIYPKKSDILGRVDFFSPVLPLEFDLVCKVSPMLRAEYVSWNYGNLEEHLIKGFEGKEVSGDAILVGNSAGFTNNHLDAFALIASLNLETVPKIVCPLSYGDPAYAACVIDEGIQYFGERFSALTEFMPLDKYVSLVLECGYVIMNHLRQQAVGNIVIMMYLGAKVFLDEKCPTYVFLKQLGAVVYSVQDLSKDASLITKALSDVDRRKNRAVVQDYWSKENINRKTLNLISIALNLKKR